MFPVAFGPFFGVLLFVWGGPCGGVGGIPPSFFLEFASLFLWLGLSFAQLLEIVCAPTRAMLPFDPIQVPFPG